MLKWAKSKRGRYLQERLGHHYKMWFLSYCVTLLSECTTKSHAAGMIAWHYLWKSKSSFKMLLYILYYIWGYERWHLNFLNKYLCVCEGNSSSKWIWPRTGLYFPGQSLLKDFPLYYPPCCSHSCKTLSYATWVRILSPSAIQHIFACCLLHILSTVQNTWNTTLAKAQSLALRS